MSIIQLLDGGNGVGVWGAFKVLFRPSTIFITAVTWLMGVVPVVVLRKRVMSGEWPVLASRPWLYEDLYEDVLCVYATLADLPTNRATV